MALPIHIHPSVQKALDHGSAVVALESTLIAHGMPWPQNFETANELEGIINEEGAVPATIAIIKGIIHVGLTPQELEHLAKDQSAIKASRRDIPYLIATRQTGATTVSGTMIAAQLAGISVFVTGGIGGVHRNVESSMDISADLTELAKTNVCVVCAGAKSVLDLPRTKEVLETFGVPVLGYQTNEFPAFYSRTSGLKVDYRVDRPEDVARLLHNKWSLGMKGAVLVANPIPEQYALDYAHMETIIAKALMMAQDAEISGKAVTPFLLATIKDLTGGKGLEANIALVKHNAKVGAQIAIAYASQQESP